MRDPVRTPDHSTCRYRGGKDVEMARDTKGAAAPVPGVTLIGSGLVWFGAALSIAEMLTGTFLAPLGIARGIAAVVVGHVIGGFLLFLAGYIGAKMRKPAMETTRASFGSRGSSLFAACNVIQLIGWTAIMIAQGAYAAAAFFDAHSTGGAVWVWCVVIGMLIMVWIALGVTNITKLNIVVCSALLVLTAVLSTRLGNMGSLVPSGEVLGFGAAVELSIAMPLSWLPLISDYTSGSRRPVANSITSAVVYTVVSCWMFIIGLLAAVHTGSYDIPSIIVGSGMGAAGLLIVILSTVTTTFLDANSAGVSAKALVSSVDARAFALVVTIVGVLLAVFTPVEAVTDFLYLIGSVFAPMIAIMIMDYFILHRDSGNRRFDWVNLAIWFVGFIIYRASMQFITPVGYTVPAMAVTAMLCLVVELVRRRMEVHRDAGEGRSSS